MVLWRRVQGHFLGERPWVSIDEIVTGGLAKLVGALPSEVVAMNSLSANLHLLMVTFYRPTKERYKILVESKSFPSDYVRGLGRLTCVVRACLDRPPVVQLAASSFELRLRADLCRTNVRKSTL